MTEPVLQAAPDPEPATQPAPAMEPAAAAPVAAPEPAPIDRRAAVFGGVALAALGLLAVGLVALVALSPGGIAGGPAASPTPRAEDFAYAEVKPAPPLQLTDQDGQPFDLASLAGRPALVFFGYTHCPDVCPATVGVVNQALGEVGPGPRAVFVSIDPERDDVAAMKSYLRYLPPAYVGLSGTPDEISRNATGWGVKYARIDQDSAGGYAMAHTAGMFLVDAQGKLRAFFPFGTEAPPIAEALRALLAETAPPSEPPATAPLPPGATPVPAATPASTPAPTPATASTAPATPAPATSAPSAATAGSLRVAVDSTSIWAGGGTPVILSISDAQGVPLDGSLPVKVRIVGADDTPAGPDVDARAVMPMGETKPYYLASVDIPSPGGWRLDVIGADGSLGSTPITALDQGSTARIGSLAPDVDTPTLKDVGGNIKALTTVVPAQADERFYTTSTADARAAGRPYVLVVDSNRFRVSPACGRAITMVEYLLDRWPGVTFVHLEPFEYQVITEEPVLSGDIKDPPLNRWTRPFGIGDEVWPATEMPWIFVVDGEGVIRAKYTGIVGSADVDVILSDITGSGAIDG
jgi:protein SCO1